jgi:hypothetical protein
MRRTLISYTVRAETAALNEELIRAVFDELARVRPENVRYTALVLDDGVSFTHIVEVRDGVNPIPELASFKRYTEAVLERCQEPPVVNQAREIGAYEGLPAGPRKASRQPAGE